MAPVLVSQRSFLDSALRSERSCVLARRGMVCTSVPAASAAGLAMLARGGNAVDAAIAAAAALCVVEPMSTGLGGDAFAMLWPAREERLVGLNGSGRAPAGATLDGYRKRGLDEIPPRGILAATVPGAVHAWETLRERYGSLPLAALLEPAIRLADEGFPVTEIVAHYWFGLERMGVFANEAARATWAPGGHTPRAGEWFRAPGLARTLRAIAAGGPGAFYAGPIADAIVASARELGGPLSHEDLAEHSSTWVEPLSSDYRGVTVVELPPNGQGLAALLALSILECFDPAEAPPGTALEWHRRIEAVKVAFADRDAYLADPEHVEVPVTALLSKSYARERARAIGERAQAGVRPGLSGETVYLCAADAEGNLVSFIQSLFTGFGCGVGCGDTGIVLQSRGAGFRLEPGHPNALAPRKRPFHTIIPAMLLRDGRPWMAFGVMGGDVQPQAHLAFVSNVVDHGLNPQEALDRPRFRFLGGCDVRVETPDAAVAEGGTLVEALRARGHRTEGPGAFMADVFGGGQAIQLLPEGVLAGASDRRKDGCALGLYD
jgi:gamma-glutamyltranspeptidase / glutathione hydrolase